MMHFVTKIVVVSTVVFVISGVMVGITIPLISKKINSGCGQDVCSDKTKCFDTLKGYSECKCLKGYTVVIDNVVGDVGSTYTACQESTCLTSSDCKDEHLCYFDFPTDQSGICSTRLKGCDGVKCPPEQDNCRESPLGFVGCFCDDGEYSSKIITETGETKITCHTLTCATSNDCDGTALCHKETCDDTLTVCTPEVVCPDGFHCDDSGDRPQCVCDDVETPTTQIMPIKEDDGRNISKRYCYRSCDNTDNCFPGTICYSDFTFIGKGCYGNRTPNEQMNKCAKVFCSSGGECLNTNIVTDCLCPNGAPTIITETATGSERTCVTDTWRCGDQLVCMFAPQDRRLCYMDPYSLQAQCLNRSEVDSCKHLKCSQNTICDPDTLACICMPGEKEVYGRCYIKCEDDEKCEKLGMGKCEAGKRCSIQPVRP